MRFVKLGLRLGRVFALGLALAAALAVPAFAQTYDGDWTGALSAGGQTLRLVLHIKTQNGEASAVLDSLDQGVSIPASVLKTENGQLSVLFLSVGGEFTGKLSADGKTLTGTWDQGASLPLTLTRK